MSLRSILDAAATFLRAEARNVKRYDVSWRRRLWLYSHGFLSSRDSIWGVDDRTVEEYLSDIEYRSLGRLDNPYEIGLQNKFLFHLMVSRTHDHLLPALHGLVRDGDFVEVAWMDAIGSYDDLEDRLASESLVVKPVRAAKGDGIRFLDMTAGRVTVDGAPVERPTLRRALTTDRDLLVTERVSQADYANRIYRMATNSLRLLTMLDPQTGDPFIASGVHRFGTESSGRTDNWSAGGVSAEIDLETGTLGRAVWVPPDRRDRVTWGDAHPDSGARIAGTVVPAWEEITESVRDLASAYAGLWPHVGWDVVVRDDTGTVAVLEGEPQSLDADQQAHAPLLADDRVRQFYVDRGVLSAWRGAER